MPGVGGGKGENVGHFIQPPELPVQFLHRLIIGYHQANLGRLALWESLYQGGFHHRSQPNFGQFLLIRFIN
jgi:hypothetical protein